LIYLSTTAFFQLYPIPRTLPLFSRFLNNEKLKVEITSLLQMEEEEVLERMKEKGDFTQESVNLWKMINLLAPKDDFVKQYLRICLLVICQISYCRLPY